MMRPSRNASRRMPMSLTLAEAALATGCNRSTILRAIKAGKISGTSRRRRRLGGRAGRACTACSRPPQAAPKAAPQDAQADAVVAELRAQLADMRSQRDAWQGIAERLALSAPTPPEPKPEARRPWWHRLRMTG